MLSSFPFLRERKKLFIKLKLSRGKIMQLLFSGALVLGCLMILGIFFALAFHFMPQCILEWVSVATGKSSFTASRQLFMGIVFLTIYEKLVKSKNSPIIFIRCVAVYIHFSSYVIFVGCVSCWWVWLICSCKWPLLVFYGETNIYMCISIYVAHSEYVALCSILFSLAMLG